MTQKHSLLLLVPRLSTSPMAHRDFSLVMNADFRISIMASTACALFLLTHDSSYLQNREANSYRNIH